MAKEELPSKLYHGTSSASAKSIMKLGLIPTIVKVITHEGEPEKIVEPNLEEGKIWLTSDRRFAEQFSRAGQLLTVDVPCLPKECNVKHDTSRTHTYGPKKVLYPVYFIDKCVVPPKCLSISAVSIEKVKAIWKELGL